MARASESGRDRDPGQPEQLNTGEASSFDRAVANTIPRRSSKQTLLDTAFLRYVTAATSPRICCRLIVTAPGPGQGGQRTFIWNLGTPEFIYEFMKHMISYMKKSYEFIGYMNSYMNSYI